MSLLNVHDPEDIAAMHTIDAVPVIDDDDYTHLITGDFQRKKINTCILRLKLSKRILYLKELKD